MSADLTGQLIGGRFQIQELIGEGGMGEVYKGFNTNMNQVVAVKVLKSEFAKDEKMKARFRREVRSTSRVQHKNVVALYDSGQLIDGRLYLVMEYINGRSIDQLLDDEGALPVARAIRIMLQISDALSIAHKFGIMHRDLKPENIIIVSEQGQDIVKVLDFGLAKMVESDNPSDKITMAGEVFGSPVYMSPEQCLGGATDIRTDIYSLGAVGFELLTGEPPFDAPNIVALMLAHKNEKPRVPSQVYPDAKIPPELDNFILKCLAKSPEDRYPSGAEVAVELRRIHDLLVKQQSGAPEDLKVTKRYQSSEYMSVGSGTSLTPSTVRSLIQQRLREKLQDLIELIRNQSMSVPQLSLKMAEISQFEVELLNKHKQKDDLAAGFIDKEAGIQKQIGQLRLAVQDLSFDYELLSKYVMQNPNITVRELKQVFSYLDEESAPPYGKDLLEDVGYQIRAIEHRILDLNAELNRLVEQKQNALQEIKVTIEREEDYIKQLVFAVVEQIIGPLGERLRQNPLIAKEINNLIIFYNEAK